MRSGLPRAARLDDNGAGSACNRSLHVRSIWSASTPSGPGLEGTGRYDGGASPSASWSRLAVISSRAEWMSSLA
jgi:hypothetical protein